MSNLVYVLNCDGKPLMPCKPQKAKMLLKSGKAKVIRKIPFTIALYNICSEQRQEVVAGMDTGSKVIGTAVIANGEIIYQAETHLRGDAIKKKMEQRAMYRRTRRGRKLRYRKPRFLNRAASTRLNRLPPSVKHKIDAHLREKKQIESILPVTKWFVETASFDIHKLTDPTVSKKNGWTYQRGPKMGFYNTKAYILNRDSYTCQKCKKNKDGLKLHIHHIEFRSNGGTDSPNNLVTLCESCHAAIHKLVDKTASKAATALQKKTQVKTRHATQISTVRSQLLKSDWDFEETFGYVTKFNREQSGLSKTHSNDAIAIASQGELVSNSYMFKYIKKLVSKGDYQQTKGPRSNIVIPTGKLFGFRKFDLIKTEKGAGFVKGKRSSGYFVISDIEGNVTHTSAKVFKGKKPSAERLSARKLILTGIVKISPSSPEGNPIPLCSKEQSFLGLK